MRKILFGLGLLFIPSFLFADMKLSNMTETTTPSTSNYMYIVENSTSMKVKISTLLSLPGASTSYFLLSSTNSFLSVIFSTMSNSYLGISSTPWTSTMLSQSSAAASNLVNQGQYLFTSSAVIANQNNQSLNIHLTDLSDGTLTGSKVGDGVPAANIAAGTLDTDVMASSATRSTFYSEDAVRTNLGLAIGSNVQAYDADLDDLADGSLTGSKVGDGVPAANIAAGPLPNDVIASSLTATGVTAGDYTNTNLSVDAQGRITAASNGSAGAGDMTYSSASVTYTHLSTFTTHATRHQDGGADEIAVTAGMMNAGTGASGSTFWRGDNTWATPAGGGGASSLAVTTGSETGMSVIIASPTAIVNFSSHTFGVRLTGGATAFVTLTPSSVTLLGADPSVGGDVSGTLSNIAVTDDSHAHTGTSLSGIDISADTNLAVTAPVVLTDDTLSLDSTVATYSTIYASMSVTYTHLSTAAASYQPLDSDLTDLADGSLTGSKVGDGVPAANIAAGSLDVDVICSSCTTAYLGVSSAPARINLGNTVVGTLPIGNLTTGASTYIQNSATLQSGATAYPNFIYTSSMTVLNGVVAGSTAQITMVIDGGGSAITTGEKSWVVIPYNAQILGWEITGDTSGSIVVDVWKDTYANYPPTVADSIAGSEKPTLSTAVKNQDHSLTTWTTLLITAGDYIKFNVDSVSTVTRVSLVLRVKKI